MSLLDDVIERLRTLPEEKQAEKVALIIDLLDENDEGEFFATDAHYAEAERRVALSETLIPHDEVFAEIYGKLGK
jgi:hypothetical protein